LVGAAPRGSAPVLAVVVPEATPAVVLLAAVVPDAVVLAAGFVAEAAALPVTAVAAAGAVVAAPVVAAALPVVAAGVLVALLLPQAASSSGTISVSNAKEVARPQARGPCFPTVPISLSLRVCLTQEIAHSDLVCDTQIDMVYTPLLFSAPE
jgi:hypothetical protein